MSGFTWRSEMRLTFLAAVGLTIFCLPATGAAAMSVPVVRCPTTSAVSGPLPSTPARIEVPGHEQRLVAYSNSEQFLLGPPSAHCTGQIGADGGAVLAVWLTGQTEPTGHSHRDGLTLAVVPGCVSCKAEAVCPFFPRYARRLAFPCTTGVPAGEHVTKPTSTRALFEDPPGVAGDGWPSGGGDPAKGVASYTLTPFQGVAYRATCTLPPRDRRICTASLNAAVARYG